MQCNINRRGRWARGIWGALMLIAGLSLAVCGTIGALSGWWVWIVAVILAASGMLGLYEARKGWCMMRAMGFRTPM